MKPAAGLLLFACVFTAVAGQYVGSAGATSLRVNGLLLKGFLEQSASGSFTGFIPEFLDALASSVGFTYKLALQPDGNYGSNSSGTWNGLVGSLVRNEIDVAAADVTITASRDSAIDFTVPYVRNSFRYIVKKGTTSLDGLRYLVQRGTAMESFLRRSNDTTVKSIWNDIQANNGSVSTDQEGIEKVAQGGFAMIGIVQGYRELVAANGQTEFFGPRLRQFFLAFGVPQGSAWRDKLGIGISQLSESGQLQSMLTKWRIDE